MKHIYRILAVGTLSLCLATAAGCSGARVSPKTATSANWNVRTSTTVEKSFSDNWLENKEVAKYSVSMTQGVNNTYSLTYQPGGEYKTEFGMVQFDWSDASIPEGYAPESGDKKELAYRYATTLTVSGEYRLASGNEAKSFDDSVTTECFFRLAGDNLQPIYSRQIIKNTAPNTLDARLLAAAYIELDCEYETFYNYSCTEATVKYTDNRKSGDNVTTSVTGLKGDTDYSVFDNSQLRLAIRAMRLNEGNNHTFYVMTPQNAAMQTVTLSCSAPAELDPEDGGQNKIIQALDKCHETNPDYIFMDKGSGDGALNYRYTSVSVGLQADTVMTGSTAEFWYSTVENADINATKGVLLKMSTPVSFGLGTINYTLEELSIVKAQ